MSGDVTRSPCGCQFGTTGDAFWFEPCAHDCDLYTYFLQESARQGKPVTTIDMRDNTQDDTEGA